MSGVPAHHHPPEPFRQIELQLVVFILVFSATGLLDLLFPAFASAYLLLLSRFAFPMHSQSQSAPPAIFEGGSSLLRLNAAAGTVLGLFLPLAYVLGGFAGGDDRAVRSHLFLLSCQIMTESIVGGLSTGRQLFSEPVRAMVPLLYTAGRVFVLADWARDAWGKPAGERFGRGLAVANRVYLVVNLVAFVIPGFLPRAFQIYFKERDEISAKTTTQDKTD